MACSDACAAPLRACHKRARARITERCEREHAALSRFGVPFTVPQLRRDPLTRTGGQLRNCSFGSRVHAHSFLISASINLIMREHERA
eukprot:5273416-Pleurochrysis_carterae.AAC.2